MFWSSPTLPKECFTIVQDIFETWVTSKTSTKRKIEFAKLVVVHFDNPFLDVEQPVLNDKTAKKTFLKATLDFLAEHRAGYEASGKSLTDPALHYLCRTIRAARVLDDQKSLTRLREILKPLTDTTDFMKTGVLK